MRLPVLRLARRAVAAPFARSFAGSFESGDSYLAFAFREFDTDGNGALSRRELLAGLEDYEVPNEIQQTIIALVEATGSDEIVMEKWLDVVPTHVKKALLRAHQKKTREAIAAEKASRLARGSEPGPSKKSPHHW
jgi:hypothetical protein